MAEYRLTPAAERDLEDIWVYTAEQWGQKQANHYIDILATTLSDLAQHPKTAPACDHIRLGYRRRSIEQHMIYFRIATYGVSIIRILHDRMDASRKL
ncbi:plasmid stabilization protein ParE [Pseudomonas brassicacearum]|uniref:type II toxin-antitoxin system RelE/ParE family toxin n=1 Tax=Pseudomonas brassicacearum TaxID=930166 RepID=UPI00042F4079|nr:type II toxin-antitoxin system RelE/ParE family toxin [Pseudomonas brassicacearum]AHL34653.1 plasmid stabilization protein ParE [Pseudomonas brassicacearum]